MHLLPFDDYSKATMYGFRTTNDSFLLTTNGGTVGSTVMTMADSSRNNNDFRNALDVRNNAWSSDTTMHDIIVIHMCTTRCYLMEVMVRKITVEG